MKHEKLMKMVTEDVRPLAIELVRRMGGKARETPKRNSVLVKSINGTGLRFGK